MSSRCTSDIDGLQLVQRFFQNILPIEQRGPLTCYARWLLVQVAYCTKRDVESGRGRDPYLKGLGNALQGLGLGGAQSRQLEQVKNNGLALFAPEKGGSYEVWRRRPLPQALIDYASLDVAYLHDMFEKWARFVPANRMRELQQSTDLHVYEVNGVRVISSRECACVCRSSGTNRLPLGYGIG